MKTLLFASAALCAITCSTYAFAQDITEVEEITVATRAPVNASKVGASVTVLTKHDIDARQTTMIGDLIAQTPSVHVTHNGPPGTASSVFIRGAASYHTVVLIDGVKLNDPSSTQGGFNFGNLLIGDSSRIEVLRGTQSVLWGSQAIGGVVNIVTADPSDGLNYDAQAEVGERSTAYIRMGVDGANDRGSFRLAGSLYNTDGFSSYALGTEADGYRNIGLAARGKLNVTESLSLEARTVYSDGRNDFDGFLVDRPYYGDTQELVAYLGLNASVLDGRLKNRIAYAHTDTDRANFDPTQPAPGITLEAEGKNRRYEYEGQFAISESWNLVFGAETETSNYASAKTANTPATNGEAQIDSLYGQVQGTVAQGLTLTGGLRQDDHDTFGGQTVGQAAAAWSFNEGATVLRASFGQGFRAPGLYELFSEYGNEGLQPEESESWEASVAQRLFEGKLIVSGGYFRREAENEIDFFSCTGAPDPLCSRPGKSPYGYYANILATETDGWEFSGVYRPIGALTVSGNFTIQDPRYAAGPNAGKTLVRRPEELGSLLLDYTWSSKLSTGLTARYVGETRDSNFSTVPLDAYTVVDLRAAWPVTETLELYGRVENVLDESYETVGGYGSAPRGAFIGVRIRR